MTSAIKELNEDGDLEKAGICLFMSDVDESSCKETIEFILKQNISPRKLKRLQLMICSNGGDVPSTFALIDVMKASKIPIHTIGLGVIASCGLLVFIAGEPGYRILTPNTSILSHQYSWGSYGKEHELFAQVKEFELSTERMISHYKKCTGLDEEKIRKHLLPPEDRWLSAKEAKKLNICDSVKTIY
ncbi:MAG: ATP-dependent Clp protease proteolytic subunit [Candidatus Pacebacteria bacterium]|nr:ATP-dependent Clp protease proteolytic subunit [Candidatus Paceibacterota bacterium]